MFVTIINSLCPFLLNPSLIAHLDNSEEKERKKKARSKDK